MLLVASLLSALALLAGLACSVGNADERVGAAVSEDHWHNSFGISVCGEWLPPLMSTVDAVGIHSHQDGLIYIHPWAEEAAHENATMGLFFDSMQISVSDDRIVLDSGRVLTGDMSCEGEPSVLRMVRWMRPDLRPDDFAVIRTGFDKQQLLTDFAGVALVIGPEAAPVEIPPSTARFSDWIID